MIEANIKLHGPSIYKPMAPRLLIADDSQTVRQVLRNAFTEAGFEVCGDAANGLEVVEKAQQLKPDVVLIDIVMPKLNGVEAVSALRKVLRPGTFIVLMTLHEAVIGSVMCSALAVDLVVSKFDGVNALVDKLQALLAGPDEIRLISEKEEPPPKIQ